MQSATGNVFDRYTWQDDFYQLVVIPGDHFPSYFVSAVREGKVAPMPEISIYNSSFSENGPRATIQTTAYGAQDSIEWIEDYARNILHAANAIRWMNEIAKKFA